MLNEPGRTENRLVATMCLGLIESRRGGAIWSSIAAGWLRLGDIAGHGYQEQFGHGYGAATAGIMQLERHRERRCTDRYGRRRGLLSLLCVLLLVLTAGLHQPAAASVSMDSSPVAAHMSDGDSRHCPPADQGHDLALSCAFAAGCAVFLPASDVRLLHCVSASGGLPFPAEHPYGQLLPPLIQPPEHILRL